MWGGGAWAGGWGVRGFAGTRYLVREEKEIRAHSRASWKGATGLWQLWEGRSQAPPAMEHARCWQGHLSPMRAPPTPPTPTPNTPLSCFAPLAHSSSCGDEMRAGMKAWLGQSTTSTTGPAGQHGRAESTGEHVSREGTACSRVNACSQGQGASAAARKKLPGGGGGASRIKLPASLWAGFACEAAHRLASAGRVLSSLTGGGGLHHVGGAHHLAIGCGHLLTLHQLAKQRAARHAQRGGLHSTGGGSVAKELVSHAGGSCKTPWAGRMHVGSHAWGSAEARSQEAGERSLATGRPGWCECSMTAS